MQQIYILKCNYIGHFKENHFKKSVIKILIFKFHNSIKLTQSNRSN